MRSLRLHLRVLTSPAKGVNLLAASARDVYRQAGVEVVIGSNQDLNLPLLEAVHVGHSCAAAAQLSVTQTELFTHAGAVGNNDIVIFFVRTTSPLVLGCAQHPPDLAAAIVTENCSRWTLAHEIGHLLGLEHVDAPSRLMHRNTSVIKNDPPALEQNEIGTILKSRLVLNS